MSGRGGGAARLGPAFAPAVLAARALHRLAGWPVAPLAIAVGAVLAPTAPHASQPLDPPRVIERAAPVLPQSLAALRLSGWVLVHVRVDSAGRVAGAEVLDRRPARFFFGPHAEAFERAAVAAARSHRMEPGAGQTSPAGSFAIPIRFGPPPDTSARATGTLAGQVYDRAGRWRLSHAGICVERSRLAALTNAAGEYRLEGLPPGRHEIHVSMDGYAPERHTVTIRPGGTFTLDLRLRPCEACRLTRCFQIPARGGP